MRTADDYVLMALASAVCFFIAFLRNLHLLENEEKPKEENHSSMMDDLLWSRVKDWKMK